MKKPRSSWSDDRLDRFESRVDERFNHLESRMDARFSHFEGEVNQRFDRIDSTLHGIRRTMIVGLAGILAAFASIVAALQF
jgi:hypothetical protein